MANSNKVRYGLKNVHYAKATMDNSGVVTYEKPEAIPGAVSLSLDAEGDTSTFYADDSPYFVGTADNGYSGDLEMALIPDKFKTDILGWEMDSNNVITEKGDARPSSFALMFEFTGDINQIRHVLYYCTAARPAMEGDTKEDSVEVKTETLSITAIPRPSDLKIKAHLGDMTSKAYDTWYDSVYEEPAESGAKANAFSFTEGE